MAKQLSRLAQDITNDANGMKEYLAGQGKSTDEKFLLASATAKYSVLKKVTSNYIDDEVKGLANELDITVTNVMASIPHYVEKFDVA